MLEGFELDDLEAIAESLRGPHAWTLASTRCGRTPRLRFLKHRRWPPGTRPLPQLATLTYIFIGIPRNLIYNVAM
jgi:hypothetical protein